MNGQNLARGVDDRLGSEARAGERADGAIERELVIEHAPAELVDPTTPGEVLARLIERENVDVVDFAVGRHDDHHGLGKRSDEMRIEVGVTDDLAIEFTHVADDELLSDADARA